MERQPQSRREINFENENLDRAYMTSLATLKTARCKRHRVIFTFHADRGLLHPRGERRYFLSRCLATCFLLSRRCAGCVIEMYVTTRYKTRDAIVGAVCAMSCGAIAIIVRANPNRFLQHRVDKRAR